MFLKTRFFLRAKWILSLRSYFTCVIFPHLSFVKRKGIVVNETSVVLYGQLLSGRKYIPKANGVVELEKQWAKQVLPFAFQTVVKVHSHTHRYKSTGPVTSEAP